MRYTGMLVALLGYVGVLIFAPPATAHHVNFITHSLGDASTYIDKYGMLRGKAGGGRRAFHVEVVIAMMRERDNMHKIIEVPLARGFLMVEKQVDYGFFHVVKTKERENKYAWVGPISDLRSMFYENASHPTGIETVYDAMKVASICVVKGSNLIGWFKDHEFTNTVPAETYDACLRLLKLGRVSLLLTSEYPWFVKAENIRNTGVFADNVTGFSAKVNAGYIVFSKTTPAPVLKEWQDALNAIKASGEFDRIKERTLVSIVMK